MTNVLFSLAVALVAMAIQTRFPETPAWALAMYVPVIGALALLCLESRQPRPRPMAPGWYHPTDWYHPTEPMARPKPSRKPRTSHAEEARVEPAEPTTCYRDGCNKPATEIIQEATCIAGWPYFDDRAYCEEHAALAEKRPAEPRKRANTDESEHCNQNGTLIAMKCISDATEERVGRLEQGSHTHPKENP